MRPLLSVFGILAACCLQRDPAQGQAGPHIPDSARAWWKEAVIYQIYPRSFKDSDGDGIGDLRGIISRLDYLQSLGIDAVWLNPIYASPNDDNGYDVSDYRSIMKEFGTMADFDELLKGLHARGIRLIMDLVVNHSSDEHQWFKQSRSSRNNPYRDYYHWWNAEDGKPPYRYSLFDINHDAWMYDSLTDAYYLHYFSRKQPDLNWENPKVRREVYDIMKFWADKGIDGFRLDAFQFAAKDTTFPEFPKGFEKDFTRYYAMQGNLHGYLREMNREVFSPYGIMGVAEGAGNTLEDAHNLVDAHRKELNMAYAFDGTNIFKPVGPRLLRLKEAFDRLDSSFGSSGWLAVYLANHDMSRLVSRMGNDRPAYRELSSKMLTTLVMTRRGTPFYYNGDELGMTNAGFTSIGEFRDVPTLDAYRREQKKGGDLWKFLQKIQFESRDNARTPFQWDGTAQAGFTTAIPWIRVNPNYTAINAAAQQNDPGSCLNYFRQLVKLRKQNEVLVYGNYTLRDRSNPRVYAFTREIKDHRMLVLLNFSAAAARVRPGVQTGRAKLLLTNYPSAPVSRPGEKEFSLRPYEACIYSL